jgi:crossover junction endodeoxyribonuclease RuvC
MRVIAVDPGYDRLGVAVMEFHNGKEQVLYSSCIETDRALPLSDRLLLIGEQFRTLLETHSLTALAIETLFFNKNQKTAMGVAQVRGMLIYLARIHHCTVYELSPQEIKVAVTGYGKSDKNAVTDMVKRLVPSAPQNALDDEYDAIAVGITCLARHGRSQ